MVSFPIKHGDFPIKHGELPEGKSKESGRATPIIHRLASQIIQLLGIDGKRENHPLTVILWIVDSKPPVYLQQI